MLDEQPTIKVNSLVLDEERKNLEEGEEDFQEIQKDVLASIENELNPSESEEDQPETLHNDVIDDITGKQIVETDHEDDEQENNVPTEEEIKKNRIKEVKKVNGKEIKDACVQTIETSSTAATDKKSKRRPVTMRLPSTFVQQRPMDSGLGFGALFGKVNVDMEVLQRHFQETFLEDFRGQLMIETSPSYHKTTTFGFLDMSPFLTSAVECMVQDSFTRCFEILPEEHWNWNIYLAPLYALGVAVRYCLLLPFRLLVLLLGFILFFLSYGLTLLFKGKTQEKLQQKALRMLGFFWVASWTGVIRYHGVCPPRRPNQIYVANHSSLSDVILLLNDRTFCLVGQRHGGVIGFFQDYVLGCMSNLWFNRLEQKDRQVVAQKIKAHLQDSSKPPLVVFPEGTCVNNEYAVMFKRGAFDLDAEVIPIAIKYNRMFADAFWNSKMHSFPRYCLRLMTSWCVVADVWYMDPQVIGKDETSIEFAGRVKQMICDRANLIPVPWDGYLKYFRPSPKETAARQKVFAEVLQHRFGLNPDEDGLNILSGNSDVEGQDPLVHRRRSAGARRNKGRSGSDIHLLKVNGLGRSHDDLRGATGDEGNHHNDENNNDVDGNFNSEVGRSPSPNAKPHTSTKWREMMLASGARKRHASASN